MGLALRAVDLGTQSLWLDELFSRGAALAPTLAEAIRRGAIDDMFPPLFPLVSYLAVRLPGDAEAMLRLPSAIGGSASLVVMYLLGRTLHSARVGLVAAALVACHWFAVAYSQEGWPYAFLLLMTSLTAYFGLCVVDRQARGRPTRGALLGLGITGFTLSYLHYVGLLFFAAEGAILLVLALRGRAPMRGLLWTYGLVGLSYLPWLGVVFAQIDRRLKTKTPPGFAVLGRTLADLCARHGFLFLLLLALGVWASRTLGAARDEDARTSFSARDRAVLIVLWIALPLVITFTLSHLVVPFYTPRNMIVVLPALALLAALALRQIERAFVRGLPVASAIAIAGLLFDLIVVKHYYQARKEPFGPFVQQVVASWAPGDALWVEPALYAGYLHQYLDLTGADLRVTPPSARKPPYPDVIWIVARNRSPHPPPGVPCHAELDSRAGSPSPLAWATDDAGSLPAGALSERCHVVEALLERARTAQCHTHVRGGWCLRRWVPVSGIIPPGSDGTRTAALCAGCAPGTGRELSERAGGTYVVAVTRNSSALSHVTPCRSRPA